MERMGVREVEGWGGGSGRGRKVLGSIHAPVEFLFCTFCLCCAVGLCVAITEGAVLHISPAPEVLHLRHSLSSKLPRLAPRHALHGCSSKSVTTSTSLLHASSPSALPHRTPVN